MIKFLKEKWIFLVFVLVVFGILSISGNFKQSTSSAKYRSEISGDDSVRVAKWDVKTISKKDGATIELDTGFGTTLATGSTGNWFIEMSNSSEVNAILGKDSTIRFRIDHSTFDKDSADSMKWDFLKKGEVVITNPVTIKVTVYKGTIDSLNIVYQTTVENNGTNETITKTKAEYEALTDEQKKAYAEVVTNEGVQMFTTSAQSFTKAGETVGGKIVYYYYKDIKVSDIAGLTDTIKTIKMNDSSTNITIGVSWATGQDGGGGSGVSDSEVYPAYELLEFAGSTPTLPTGYSEVGRKTLGEGDAAKTYIVAYRNCYFFDYQIFTSGFGGDGEPYFKFDGLYDGTELIIYYSELAKQSKETIVASYSKDISAATTEEALQHVVDRYRYEIHKKFLDDNKKFQESLTYLQYGLTCSVQFTLKVEQID